MRSAADPLTLTRKPAATQVRPPIKLTRKQNRTERILNLPVRPLGLHSFTPERFHVLLNSLFKVLFNFPSRYLFTIGLVVVFSLRWSLPPVLGLHSQATRLPGEAFSIAATIPQAWHLLRTMAPFKRDLDRPQQPRELTLLYATFPASPAGLGDSALGFSPFARRYSGNPC